MRFDLIDFPAYDGRSFLAKMHKHVTHLILISTLPLHTKPTRHSNPTNPKSNRTTFLNSNTNQSASSKHLRLILIHTHILRKTSSIYEFSQPPTSTTQPTTPDTPTTKIKFPQSLILPHEKNLRKMIMLGNPTF
jgi:hypothetical protein